MQSHTKSFALSAIISALMLTHCNTGMSVQEKKDNGKTASKYSIKHMLEDLEEYVSDLADTVTLHTNRIDGRLNTIEDKLDLILGLLINQEIDEAY